MKKKIISAIICAILFCLIPVAALAVDHPLATGETINLATDCSAGDTVTVAAGASVTITGSQNNIQIICGAGASVTLSGVTINNNGYGEYVYPIAFTGSGNALILAAGTENTLTGSNYAPGVCVQGTTVLTISGTGKLTANGGAEAAGIGGEMYNDGGSITISGSADVTASGGYEAAGIGGGYQGDGGTITILGGTVRATGGDGGGAGIGSGDGGDVTDGHNGGTITISGGSVTAYGGGGSETEQGYDGAGIGGGDYCSGGNITISGNAVVNAIGGYEAAAIGGGYWGDGGSITISENAVVTAYGGYEAAGIGSGYEPYYDVNTEITISGGTVTAYGGESSETAAGSDGAGIGGGNYGNGGTIEISGGTVTAKGGEYAAGIGGGGNEDEVKGGDGGDITISGGVVTATAGGYAAGIGSGSNPENGDLTTTITISGGDVTASSETAGAGIGGGNYGSGGTIEISGGTVDATGGTDSAGIGGGYEAPYAATINISGGDITAQGGESGAGIGSGYLAHMLPAITISGGTIDATGGNDGAAIGGAYASDNGSIIITGGSITATGGIRSAAIGGGFMSDGGTIDISGGVVYATKAATGTYDIGQGAVGWTSSSAGTISISGAAAVLLGTDTISPSPPTTTTHTHYTFTVDTEDAYGIPVPAEWTPTFGAYIAMYDLNYNANGGSGTAPATVSQLAGSNTVVSVNTFTNAGYSFDDWNTTAGGLGTPYNPGETFTFPASDTTLYAQWTAHTYTVQYDANDGTGSTADSSHTYDVYKALTANGFTRTGYDFAGWAESAGGAVVYTDGQSVKNLTTVNGATVTLYAQWTAHTYTVQYDANGGVGTMTDSSFTYNVSGTLSDNSFTMDLYVFVGWAESAAGDVVYTDGQSVLNLTSDDGGVVILYAKWTELTLESTDADATIYVGGRFTLTPNVDGGEWDWDEEYLSATFNSPATFTGLKAGTTTITYTVDGVSTTYDITIEAGGLPSTGQDLTWVWALMITAGILITAGMFSRRRKSRKA